LTKKFIRIDYTRNGAFSRNAEGLLTTSSGYVVQPEIQIPLEATQVNISADGIVSVQIPGAVEAEEIGQMQLADFPNRRGSNTVGESFLVETPASGEAVISEPFVGGMGKLVQGALESSNVNVVQELVDMIETQRAYEVNSKAISGVDDMLRFINQNL
jgi:flagellar basal-body rod protein FlgG